MIIWKMNLFLRLVIFLTEHFTLIGTTQIVAVSKRMLCCNLMGFGPVIRLSQIQYHPYRLCLWKLYLLFPLMQLFTRNAKRKWVFNFIPLFFVTLFDWRFVFYLAPHLYIFVVLDTPLFPQLLDFVPCLRGNLKDLRQNKGLSQMIMLKKNWTLAPTST